MADPPRVLVVEDNDMNYELASVILRQMGVTVRRVADGDQVVSAVESDPPDLIYMDVLLPGMDGLEITRQLKANERTRGIPIVALTALAMMGDYARALAAGCDSYIIKPISPAEFRAQTHRFLPALSRSANGIDTGPSHESDHRAPNVDQDRQSGAPAVDR